MAPRTNAVVAIFVLLSVDTGVSDVAFPENDGLIILDLLDKPATKFAAVVIARALTTVLV
jgi:hypothetical protein